MREILEYDKIKIREFINKKEFSDMEAYEIFKNLFFELERVALERFVIVEKTLKSNKHYNHQIDLMNALEFYNKSFSKMSSCFVGLKSSEFQVYENLINQKIILNRFVMFEKDLSHGGTCPYDIGKEKQPYKAEWVLDEQKPNIEIKTDIDEILEKYNLIESD